MRPLFLSLQGFMAFRDRTEVDFTAMEVFVLTGPTGSGKSSLLDAICFALYGETPRVGPREIKKLIYQDIENPRNQAQVNLAFRIGGQDYRITRQISASTHRIELETRPNPDAPWQSHITGSVNEFKTLMPELLGLDFAAFSRVLLLPQGGFDQFLKQDGPNDRRKMLLSLAQLEVYEQIQQQAEGHRTRLRGELAHLDGQLQGIGAVSPDDISALVAQLDAERIQLEMQAESCQEGEAALREAESLWQLLSAQAATQAELQSLSEAQPALDKLRTQLQQGRELQQLGGDFRQLDQLLQRQTQQAQQLENLQREQAQQENALAQLAAQETELAQQLELQPAWEAERDQLQSLRPRLEQLRRIEQEQTQLQRQHQTLQRDWQAAGAQCDASTQQLNSLEAELAALEARRPQGEANPARLETLQSVGGELARLQNTDLPRLAALEAQLQENEQALQIAADEQAQQNEALAQAQARLDAAEAAVAAAETRMRELEIQQQAEALRHVLAPGAPCPVCTQTVHTLPPAPADGALPRQQALLKNARQTRSQAHESLQRQLRRQSEAAARWQALQRQLPEQQQHCDQLRQHCASETQRLASELGVDVLPDVAELRAEFTQLKQQAKALEKFRQDLEQLERQREAALQAQALARQAQALHARSLEQLDAQRQRSASQQADEISALTAVLGPQRDPAGELEKRLREVVARLQQLSQRERRLREERNAREQALVRARTAYEHSRAALSGTQAETRAVENTLTQAVTALGHSIGSARLALPPPELLREWEERLQQHASQQEALLREAHRLQSQIAGRSITEAALEALRDKVSQLQRGLQSLTQAVAVLQSELARLRERLAQSERIQLERAALAHQLGLYERIYDDLGARRLPDFLAKRILERVMATGSEELEALSSGRYRFHLDANEDLVVLDAWNALEPRAVKTLSGGESFLASLALALALNQYLSSGLSLDSLFIDEGFGTLDGETLELAAEVIEKLQANGKCIGVITHIPELAERFEVRLRVTKSETGALLQMD
ncbi:MAG: AAA family ATPase [Candidatus Sericytochromatia bacterium]